MDDVQQAQHILEESTDLINDAIYWRGLFIHRYSGIEFAFNDLLARCYALPEYRKLGLPPKLMKNKLRRFRDIVEIDGPLTKHRITLTKMVKKFEVLEPTRNFIAHAMMGRLPKSDDPDMLAFRMYRRSGETLDAGVWNISRTQLREYAEGLSTLSRAFMATVIQIGKEHPMAFFPIDGVDDEPKTPSGA
jgi:hypothetical protein